MQLKDLLALYRLEESHGKVADFLQTVIEDKVRTTAMNLLPTKTKNIYLNYGKGRNYETMLKYREEDCSE